MNSNRIYIRLDVDNAGDGIELALLESDYKKAQTVHNRIQNGIRSILVKIKKKGLYSVLMTGCDDILFSVEVVNYDLTFLKKIKSEFKEETGFSLSIGVGDSIRQCLINLRIAKISGKDRIVEKQ